MPSRMVEGRMPRNPKPDSILSRLRAALDHIYGDRLDRVVLYPRGSAYAYATACAAPRRRAHRNRIARLELRSPASVNGASAEVLPADRSPGFVTGRCG